MNNLHKSLIIATLIISTFISGTNVDLDDGFFCLTRYGQRLGNTLG
jgi:hypothetical protein